MVYNEYKKRSKLSIPLGLSVLLLLVGSIARVQHRKYGIEIEQTAFALIALLYCVRYFGKNKKTFKDTVKLILILAWCSLSVAAYLNQGNNEYVIYSFMALGVFWFALEVLNLLKMGLGHSNMILLAGAFTLAIEGLFRIQHWPFGSLMHVLALLLIAIGFFVDNFRKLTN